MPNPAGCDIELTKQKMDLRMEAIETKRSRDAVFDRALARMAKKRVDAAMATK